MFDLTSLDTGHLLALNRALHEARFCVKDNDPVVWSSPLVVDLHAWTLEEMRKRDESTGRSTDWDEWLSWGGREEADTVVRRLRANRKLLEMEAADPGLFRDILRPFVVEDADLHAMISACGTFGGVITALRSDRPQRGRSGRA